MNLPIYVQKNIVMYNYNYNIFTKKNTVYENILKNIWDITINQIQYPNEKLFINPDLYNDKSFTNYDLPNIKNYFTMAGGSLNEYLGINLEFVKKSSFSKKYVIATSLFQKTTPNKYKNINHYIKCLYNAIILYIKYVPNFKIIIYTDDSLNILDDEETRNIYEKIKQIEQVEIIKVIHKLSNEYNLFDRKDPKGGYVGLLGALFRFYTLLDPEIENCMHVDSDNIPMEIFCNIIKEWITSDKDILIFKPLYYERLNINNNCIQQVMAGLFGFKKNINEVLNPLIFKDLFNYIDKNYEKFKTSYIDNCDSNLNKQLKNPFDFSFEEQALSNILVPYLIKNNKKFMIIPMYFDFGKEFKFYYSTILKNLTPEFREKMNELLGINYDSLPLLTYVEPLFAYNIHIALIFINVIIKLLEKNDNNVTLYGIKVFNDNTVKFLQMHISLLGMYALYPAFNLSFPINKINEYINNIMNSKTINKICFIKYSLDAHREFNKDTNFYNNYISDNLTNTPLLIDKLIERSPINMLSTSDIQEGQINTKNNVNYCVDTITYKQKYLKYKQKYLKLKNNM